MNKEEILTYLEVFIAQYTERIGRSSVESEKQELSIRKSELESLQTQILKE